MRQSCFPHQRPEVLFWIRPSGLFSDVAHKKFMRLLLPQFVLFLCGLRQQQITETEYGTINSATRKCGVVRSGCFWNRYGEFPEKEICVTEGFVKKEVLITFWQLQTSAITFNASSQNITNCEPITS